MTARLIRKDEHFNFRGEGSYHLEERYSNGYGISVVHRPGEILSCACNPYRFRDEGSYGSDKGLLQLAVIEDRPDDSPYTPQDPDRWPLCYTTPIASDILGWLNFEEVEEISRQVRELPEISKEERVYQTEHRFDWVEEEGDEPA